jgi:predicted Zn-ribbon and HTH transcriptional regulator
MSIEDRICRCVRCGYEWVKRVGGRPVRCPHCKEHDWDKPVGMLKVGRPKKKAPAKKKRK